MMQLSLADSQPIAMIADNLTEAADVVHKACQRDIGFRADYSDRPDKQTVHAPLHEAEDMLHTAADFGLLPVVGLLNLCQRMVSVSFLAYDGSHSVFPYLVLLAGISGIKIQGFPLVLLREQGGDLLRVVHAGRCRLVGEHDLRFGTDLGVVLVPVVALTALLRPTGVDILMAFLVRVVIPQLVATAFLYRGVLITGIALTGSDYKTCVHNLAAVENQTPFLHVSAEHAEQPVIHATGGQCLTVFPDCLLIGDFFNALDAKEPAEARHDPLSDTGSGGRQDRSSVAGTAP